MSGDGLLPLDRPSTVRAGEELPAEQLALYLQEALPGLAGPLRIEQFGQGHSNLTYALSFGDRDLVLRRPPFGAAIETAHDMGREYRVLSALAGTYAKAPRPVHFCEDPAILGAPFYVMERVRGVILRGSQPAGVSTLGPVDMRRLSQNLVDGLAELHAVDPAATGLEQLGNPEGYVRRQVEGWTGRYCKAQTDEIVEIDQVAWWLAEQQPPEAGTALIHNDYKYDNLVLDPAEPTRIVAVLDWEMATRGDPSMDLGTSLGYWIEPTDPEPLRMLPLGPTLLPGNLTRAEVVERYQRVADRQVSDPLFYYLYGLFKVAVIAQQIYQRFVEGHTKDPRFSAMIVGVRILGQQAARAIERGRIHDLG